MFPITTHRIGIFVLSLVAALAAGGLIFGLAGVPRATAAPGSGASPAGVITPDNQIWHQNVADVEGGAEADDHFGDPLAAGDFNGDGELDLAIGVPDEDVEALANAGAVNVLYGSGGGLTAAGDQIWHQDVAEVEGGAEAGDRFGWALAAGDFNNDGRDDLAIGVPFEDIGSLNAAGAVNVLYGSAGGLAVAGDQIWHQDVTEVEGVAEASDGLGSTLAAGDFNNDGRDDLAIGVPFEAVGTVSTAGAVNVLYGSAGGLAVAGDQIWHQDTADIEGVAEAFDRFGLELAAGDFNGDGRDDLAVGVPFESVDTVTGAGAVNVLYGSAGGLAAAGNQIWHQDVADVDGAAEVGDGFGRALAAGGFSDDGRDDLAVGVPYEDIDSVADAGAVNVLYSSGSGLTAVGNQIWHQDVNSVEGAAEADDFFGQALAADDFNGDGQDDLAIGVPFEDVDGVGDAGAVNVLYGEGSGLARTGNQIWHQNVAGVEGEAEASDTFGSALAAGHFNDDGRDDLAIGVPQEDIDALADAGAVNVIYSSPQVDTPTPTDTPPAEATPTNTPPAATNTPPAGATSTPTPPAVATATNTPVPPTPTRTPTPQAGLPGDANCDGMVNPIDATVILQFTAGLVGSVGCPGNADVNEDGQINSLDAALILQFVAGLIGSL